MAHQQNHGLNEANIGDFHRDLIKVLKKYQAYTDGSKLELKTDQLKLVAKGIQNCRPECIQSAEVCDVNGNNCHLKVWCQCD